MPHYQPTSCIPVDSSIASYTAEMYVDCAGHDRQLNIAIGRNQGPRYD